MRVVMTLCVKDEEDILDAQLAFHLRVGVDHVIVTDTGSTDGSLEILERYEKAGLVTLLHDHSRPFRQSELSTRMARTAAADLGADWVVNADADEFWWPRDVGFERLFDAVPARYGTVRAVWRPFVPRPDDGERFDRRMTVRLAGAEAINAAATPFRPNSKVAHRGDPDVRIGAGNHDLIGSSFVPLRGWAPIEILHFPLRSAAQAARKYESADRYKGIESAGLLRRAAAAGDGGRLLQDLVVDDDQLEAGLTDGTFAIDTRLRDALGLIPESESGGFELRPGRRPTLPLQPPSILDDATWAKELTVLGDAELVRTQRSVDLLERRVAELEDQARFGIGRLVRAAYRRMRALDRSK